MAGPRNNPRKIASADCGCDWCVVKIPGERKRTKRHTGMWQARWRDADGVQRSGNRPTEREAIALLEEMRAAVRAGTYRDPRAGATTVDEWWEQWHPAQDVAQSTIDWYRRMYRNHIKPQWGARALGTIRGVAIATWEKELRAKWAESTVESILKLFALLLADAVWEGLIPSSPVRPRRRRGKRKPREQREGIAVGLRVILALAARMVYSDALMTLVAFFTGMRWGEVAGMRRSFLVLVPADGDQPATGYYVIDPKIGALHESDTGQLYFGPPKGGKGRNVDLPPFLVELLLAWIDQMPANVDALFRTPDGKLWRRSSWNRRVWRKACDGWAAREARRGRRALEAAPPIYAGLHFHDTRHSHKTMLDEDHVQGVAQDERLGHSKGARGIQGVYSHPTPAMRTELLDGLQRRWEAEGAAVWGALWESTSSPQTTQHAA